MTQHQTINHLNLFSYYKIERFAAEHLRVLLSQLLETYMEHGDCVVLLSLKVDNFKTLAQAYCDILTGYRHPRKDSLTWRYRTTDRTLRKLAAIFPELAHAEQSPRDFMPSEKHDCQSLNEKKPKSNNHYKKQWKNNKM